MASCQICWGKGQLTSCSRDIVLRLFRQRLGRRRRWAWSVNRLQARQSVPVLTSKRESRSRNANRSRSSTKISLLSIPRTITCWRSPTISRRACLGIVQCCYISRGTQRSDQRPLCQASPSLYCGRKCGVALPEARRSMMHQSGLHFFES